MSDEAQDTHGSPSDDSRTAYDLRDELPTPEEFLSLRESADMAPRSREGVERGLPNSVFGVTVIEESSGDTVGMARIVGDDGSIYHICDMVVHPDHQGQGLGSRMMERLLAYVEETAPDMAYVNLMADVDGFYEQFGFEYTAPVSRGMYMRVNEER